MPKVLQKLLEKLNDVHGITAFVPGLLSGMFIIYGACPLACAVFVAFAILGEGEYMAGFGAAVGIILRSEYQLLIPLGICVFLCFIWKLWQGDKLSILDRLLILIGSQLSVILLRHETLTDCISVPIMCVVSVVAAILMYNGICSLKLWIKKKRLATDGELFMVSAVILLSLILLSPLSTEHIHTAAIVAGVLTQTAACLSGMYGLCLVVFGALGACFDYVGITFSIDILGVIALASVICSLVKNNGRFVVAISYFAVSFMIGVLTCKCMTLQDCFIAAVLFMCIPKRAIYVLDSYFVVGEGKKDTAIKRRLHSLARATVGINDALDAEYHKGDNELAVRQLRAISGILDSMGNEKPKKCIISVEVGMACIPKNKCANTGDSVGSVEAGGKAIVAVSDGMGSGILAHNESSAAVESFIDMMRAGFNTCDSIDCVNRRLIARCETEFYATLDALIIDRRSCIATAVKLGAPPSFLVRDGAVHDICGESLPLGILDTVLPAVKKLQVHKGDFFLILTDGVHDALGSGLVATITEHIEPNKSPSTIANELLDIASYDGVGDDMSIVCVKVK